MLAKSTSRESWKIALVPLPWCTSQSSTSTRSAPSESSAWRAAIATFANRQKPMRPSPLGVVPGRAERREAGALAAAEQRLDERARAARRPQRGLVGAGAGGRVHVERLAARADLAHALHVLARVHAQQLLLGGRGRLARLPAEPVAASSSASIARMRSGPLGVAVARCRARARPGGGRTAACAPVRYRRAVDEPLRTDVAVVGAGAAGLYAALVAADEGASVALVSRSPLAQTASYWAQGGIAAALADGRLAGAARRGHARRRPRRRARERGAGALRGVARARARPRGARRQLRRRPPRQPRARPRGRPLASAGSSTPAARPPGGASPARCPRSPPRTSASQVLEPVAATALATRRRPLRRPRRAPRDGGAARRLGARGDPRHRRHGRALGSAPRTRAARSAPG